MESPRPESGLTRSTAGLPAPSAAEIQRIAPDLIETMRLEQGRVALWPGHRARLRASARALGYPLDEAVLESLMEAQIRGLAAQGRQASETTTGDPAATDMHPPCRLRLLLAADGALSLTCAPLPPTTEPVRIALAADVLGPQAVLEAADPWLRHKTTHRPGYAAAQRWLSAHPDYFDLIFGNAAGDLCEGSRSTIYVQDADGAWLTPPLACGLLPGVRRQALLDEGAVREARLSLADLRQAPALRVSNALRGWMSSDMK